MPRIQEADRTTVLLTDFSTKLKDVEERHDLLKERVDLLNQTFLKEEKRIVDEIISMKNSLREIKEDTEKIKEGLRSIISESAGFARKEELGILERYMKLWEPLKFVREEDVKKMIADALKEKSGEIENA